MPVRFAPDHPVHLNPADGARLCLRFCRSPVRLMALQAHRARRLSEGEALCALYCRTFIRGRPVTLNFPAARGRRIATAKARTL
ncbi:MAG: hypothetical protein AB8B85_05840 [Paracoccaceae bacterium]